MATEYIFDTLKVSMNGHVASVTIANARANAMNTTFFQDISQCFHRLAQDASVRCILLKASGKYFTVGLDLKDAEVASSLGGGEESRDTARKYMLQRNHVLELQETFSALERCPQPIVAAVHGACIGGGIDLLCCCDIRLAQENAWFSIKEVDVGLAADLGTLQRLPSIVGNDSKIRELAYTARRFDAQEAKEIGFLSEVLPDRDSLYERAAQLAAQIASKSPVAITGTKLNLNYARDHSVADSLVYQATWSGAALQTDDLVKSFMASLQKKKAVYSKL